MIKIKHLSYDLKKEPSGAEMDLYWEYKNELWKIAKDHPYSRAVVDSWYGEILETDTYLVRVLDTRMNPSQVGFIFIGVESNCHPDADYYVQDCYVRPEYRRSNIMETAFQSFIVRHDGRYCLFLIDDNEPAVLFWKKQFEVISKYREVPITDFHGMETPWCHLHAFEPKEMLE